MKLKKEQLNQTPKNPFLTNQKSNSLSSINLNKKSTSPSFSDILSIPSNPEDFFTIISFIGKGAFGSVYKALHNSSNQEYAIKIISYNFSSPHLVNYQSIQQEISLMKLCESPFVVKYYGSYYSRKSNSLWLILEYCSSGSAIDLMSAMGRTLQEIELASIIEMVLNGLIVIHSLNLIHRDIKGANILIDEDGYAKLADFGVGVQLTEDENYRSSKKGSPYWMSPQVCNNSYYDTKTDIWSLGITCIELMEGDPPYNDIKPNMVMNLIIKDPPTGKKLFNKERLDEFKYSKDFVNFVSLCLEVDPDKRPSAEELIQHDFIKKFSKGREIIKQLVMYHMDDIEKFREEEEEEMKNENKKDNNYYFNNNYNNINNYTEDLGNFSKNEDIKIESVNDEYILNMGKKVITKGKIENEKKIFGYNKSNIHENEDDYNSNDSVIMKNTNNSKFNSYDNGSVINKNSINTINTNNNGNIETKPNNSPEFMKYVLNNQFIFNEDDYIAIETKNMVENLNNESNKIEDNENDFEEITEKINQLEIQKEKEINEYEKKIKKYKKIQKIMSQYGIKSIKEYEEFIKNHSIENTIILTTDYKSSKETVKDEINIDHEMMKDTIDDKGVECGVRNDHKILKIKSFSKYFS